MGGEAGAGSSLSSHRHLLGWVLGSHRAWGPPSGSGGAWGHPQSPDQLGTSDLGGEKGKRKS